MQETLDKILLELEKINSRIDNLENTMEENNKKMYAYIDQKFEENNKKMYAYIDQKIEGVYSYIDQKIKEVYAYIDQKIEEMYAYIDQKIEGVYVYIDHKIEEMYSYINKKFETNNHDIAQEINDLAELIKKKCYKTFDEMYKDIEQAVDKIKNNFERKTKQDKEAFKSNNARLNKIELVQEYLETEVVDIKKDKNKDQVAV